MEEKIICFCYGLSPGTLKRQEIVRTDASGVSTGGGIRAMMDLPVGGLGPDPFRHGFKADKGQYGSAV